MSPRTKWTTGQIRNARRVELKPLLEKHGFRMQALTGGNWRVYDLPKEIIIKQHYWSCPEDGTGGNAIDLLTHVIGMSFSEAMEKLEPLI